ncbi:DUF6020 family protein [Streptomyces sp. NBC_01216]|uniref:DUF6020 family protein n=1 Tax=Streptomyces sp. NBC_01216 TaxID=2903778 RepID=UPI002E0F1AFE|nr:DUF6020 family protein [Streptomyces sp. NBC_01216]
MNFPRVPYLSRQWDRIPERRRLPVAVYAASQVMFLLWWAAFYPGALSYDSITYVWHVTTGNWESNHSVVYDALVWLSLNTTGDLAVLTLAQTIAMSAVLAYTAGTLREWGVRQRWAAVAAVALTVAPPTAVFVIFVWKDVPFVIGGILAFAAVGRLAARRARGRQAERDRVFYRDMGLLFLGFLALSVFRNNGILVAVVAAPILLLSLPRMRRWLLAATAVPVSLFLFLTTVFYPAVGVTTPPKDAVYAFFYADIAVAYKEHPGYFTKEDKSLMADIAPLSHWRGRAGNCYNADWAMESPPMNRSMAAERNDELMALWRRVLNRTPDVVIGARVCRAHIAWAVFPGPEDLRAHTLLSDPHTSKTLFSYLKWNDDIKNSEYRPILKIRPLNDSLHSLADFSWRASKVPQLQWLLFRGAIWCYATYAIVLLFRRRTRLAGVPALLAVTLGLQLTVLAANPAPLWRYMIGPIFIGVLVLPLIKAKPRFGGPSHRTPATTEKKTDREPEPEPEPVY